MNARRGEERSGDADQVPLTNDATIDAGSQARSEDTTDDALDAGTTDDATSPSDDASGTTPKAADAARGEGAAGEAAESAAEAARTTSASATTPAAAAEASIESRTVGAQASSGERGAAELRAAATPAAGSADGGLAGGEAGDTDTASGKASEKPGHQAGDPSQHGTGRDPAAGRGSRGDQPGSAAAQGAGALYESSATATSSERGVAGALAGAAAPDAAPAPTGPLQGAAAGDAARDAAALARAAHDATNSPDAERPLAQGDRASAGASPSHAFVRDLFGHAMQGLQGPRGADSVSLGNATASGLPTPAVPDAGADGSEAPTTKLVARGLSALVGQKGGSMQIRLDPPSLGDLRITMTVVNGVVNAELKTAHGQAHALLAADLTSLRQALEAQGLTVERLSIQHQPQPSPSPSTAHRAEHAPAAQQPAPSGQPHQQGSSGDPSSQQDRQQDRQQRHDASHGQSRGRSDGDGRERDGGSGQRRRRASFATVFATSDLP